MLYFGIILASVAAGIAAKKHGIILERNVLLLVAVIEIAGTGIGAYDYYSSKTGFAGKVERPAAGEAEKKENLLVDRDGQEEEWEISVSPQELEAKAIEERLNEAEKEIDDTVFGRNPSANEVTEDLVIQDTYAGGVVNADWMFSDPLAVSTNGKILYENLETKASETVYATAKLSCYGRERIHTFPFRVVMPKASTAAGFAYYMQKALEKADAQAPAAREVVLPKQIENIPLRWSKQTDNRGVWISALGLLAGAGIVLGKREEEKRVRQQRQKELGKDYPDIVSALSLYVSAGITVRSAFTRIFAGYVDRRKRGDIRGRPGYEVIGKIVRQMEDGVGEESAYQSLGTLTGHKDYGKLAIMLTKNLRHGTAKLAEQLEKEETQAFEMRKLTAKTMGEEASTKLLAPMLMLLAVVLVILVAPALCNLQM
ncbi:MAG: type II secretion system F family protein [Lachnospiraceae bacterium]|nr:type II secretion system F family protein [Lachnospiraceae bacterium]